MPKNSQLRDDYNDYDYGNYNYNSYDDYGTYNYNSYDDYGNYNYNGDTYGAYYDDGYYNGGYGGQQRRRSAKGMKGVRRAGNELVKDETATPIPKKAEETNNGEKGKNSRQTPFIHPYIHAEDRFLT